ncbi:MAG: hypothetical protein KAI66_26370, partial [Lentisphaeria bacterium]|nr:hypothetical protein [Lentisphaeria bacterium]
FVSSMPEPFLPLLKAIPEGRWRLYAYLSRCGPAATELAQSHLPLAFALAHADVFHSVSRPLRSVRALIHRKRRDILAWLGFPGSTSAVRLLERLDPASLTVQRLLEFRHLLNVGNKQDLKLLRHAPRIHGELIDCFGSFRAALTPQLVRDMSNRATAQVVLHQLARLMFAQCGLDRPLSPVHSAGQLKSLLARTEREWRHLDLRRLLPEGFPPPPVVPGPESGIKPIRALSELITEAEMQRNCCVNYAHRILAGDYYIYRVTSPVRATLSLLRASDGVWQIGQLLAACNQPLSLAVRTEILFPLLNQLANEGPAESLPQWTEAAPPTPPF